MKYNKSHFILWGTAAFILILGLIYFIYPGTNKFFDLNIFDTYLVISTLHLTLFLPFVCFIAGAGYKFMNDAGKSPIVLYTRIHVITTVATSMICGITAFTISRSALAAVGGLQNIFIASIVILILVQILYFINLILTATRKII